MWAFTAWDINGEDYLQSREAALEQGDYPRYGRRKRSYGGGYDPNYYHTWYTFIQILETHDSSYLVEYLPGFNLKIPKKIVRGIRDNKYGKTEMLVHSGTFAKIVEKTRDSVVDALVLLPELD